MLLHTGVNKSLTLPDLIGCRAQLRDISAFTSITERVVLKARNKNKNLKEKKNNGQFFKNLLQEQRKESSRMSKQKDPKLHFKNIRVDVDQRHVKFQLELQTLQRIC